jgi:hypothetical protein
MREEARDYYDSKLKISGEDERDSANCQVRRSHTIMGKGLLWGS